MNKTSIFKINFFRELISFLFLYLITVLVASGQTKDTNDLKYIKEKRVDSLFNLVIGKNVPGSVVLVSKNGEILLNKAYGYADIESERKNSSDTRFRIASLTKQFTAFSILRLQEQDKLNVKDPLSKYLPDFPRGDEIQIENLVTHTSGIFNFTRLGAPVMVDLSSRPVTADELIKVFIDKPFDFDPGTDFTYCNSGYVLLVKIIEMLSEKSYAEFLKDEFFVPLGMNSTEVIKGDSLFGIDAVGYRFQDNKFNVVDNWYMDWAMGAGNISSTVGDLFKWNEALYRGEIVNLETLKQAFKPHPASINKEEGNYGYGLNIESSNDLETISHGGGMSGFGTFLIRYPQYNLTVVVLNNMAPPPDGLEPDRLAKKIAKIYIEK